MTEDIKIKYFSEAGEIKAEEIAFPNASDAIKEELIFRGNLPLRSPYDYPVDPLTEIAINRQKVIANSVDSLIAIITTDKVWDTLKELDDTSIVEIFEIVAGVLVRMR
jgi:hypothetical protein